MGAGLFAGARFAPDRHVRKRTDGRPRQRHYVGIVQLKSPFRSMCSSSLYVQLPLAAIFLAGLVLVSYLTMSS